MCAGQCRRPWTLLAPFIVSYNVLSLRSEDRIADILDEFSNAQILLLQGTRHRARSQDEHFSVSRSSGFWIIHFGYYTGGNSHAGVSICLSTKVYDRSNIVSIVSSNDPCVRGRLGLVRLKQGASDITVASVYLPPGFADGAVRAVYAKVLASLQKAIDRTPSRSLPIIGIDANAHLGFLEKRSGERQAIPSCSVGLCEQERENQQGTAFREWLERNHFVAVNSYYEAGKTFFGTQGSATRVDYLITSRSAYEAQRIKWCKVLHRAGDRLQLIRSTRRADHHPVCMRIRVQLTYATAAAEHRWDADLLVKSVHQQTPQSEAFKLQVNEWLTQSQEQWYGVQDNSVSIQWDFLACNLYRIAKEHFAARKPEKDSTLAEQRVRLLRERRQLRLLHRSGHEVVRELIKVEKQIKRRARERSYVWKQTLIEELALAQRTADLRNAWRISRLLGGQARGPKKRRMNTLPDTLPSREEWIRHLAKDGPSGGCSATLTSMELFTQAYEELPCSYPNLENIAEAQEDLKVVLGKVRRAKCRKGTPEGDIPVEVWKILLLRQRDRYRWLGMGQDCNRLPCDKKLNGRLEYIIACSRASQRPPWQWNVSQAWRIPKFNGKEGPLAVRIVHGLISFAKCYFSALYERQEVDRYPNHCFSAKRRRREEGIACQCILSHLLCRNKIPHYTEMYDVSNAFPSVSHKSVIELVSNCRLEEEAALFVCHIVGACFLLDIENEKVMFEPGTGIFAGASVATVLFGGVYWPCLEAWRLSTSDKMLYAKFPLSNELVDCSMTSFVDDVARKQTLKSNDARQALDHAKAVQDSLDSFVTDVGVAQNKEKSVRMVALFGPGSHDQERRLYHFQGELRSDQISREARYLGPHINLAGNACAEVDRRLSAAQRAWGTMSRFWFVERSKKIRRIVFIGLCQSTLLSGLTAFVLSQNQIKKIDRWLVHKLRRMMLDKATVKNFASNGDVLHTSLSNSAVLKHWRIPPTWLELSVQRLRLFQAVCQEPSNHKLFLTCMFSRFPFQHRQDSNKHPWNIQLSQDLRLLLQFDCLYEFIVPAVDYPQCLLLEGDARNAFVSFDMCQLRATHTAHNSIPPPTHSLFAPTRDEGGPGRPGEDGGSAPMPECEWKCELKLADGSTCGRSFRSFKGLQIHKVKAYSLGGEHRAMAVGRIVITNQCPMCASAFSSRQAAKQHLNIAMRSDVCTVDASFLARPVSVPKSICCKICGRLCPTLDEYNQHVLSHVPRPKYFSSKTPGQLHLCSVARRILLRIKGHAGAHGPHGQAAGGATGLRPARSSKSKKDKHEDRGLRGRRGRRGDGHRRTRKGHRHPQGSQAALHNQPLPRLPHQRAAQRLHRVGSDPKEHNAGRQMQGHDKGLPRQGDGACEGEASCVGLASHPGLGADAGVLRRGDEWQGEVPQAPRQRHSAGGRDEGHRLPHRAPVRHHQALPHRKVPSQGPREGGDRPQVQRGSDHRDQVGAPSMGVDEGLPSGRAQGQLPARHPPKRRLDPQAREAGEAHDQGVRSRQARLVGFDEAERANAAGFVARHRLTGKQAAPPYLRQRIEYDAGRLTRIHIGDLSKAIFTERKRKLPRKPVGKTEIPQIVVPEASEVRMSAYNPRIEWSKWTGGRLLTEQ
eukprot:TRINITY_DN13845_c0_g1_i1.p1 TRINITY_DN13845_c0_g1~~TRINITY_DN13845_c0_g1_i1.p1  ORF type:complete len:1628 (-),score=116.54 TRINITY_DN13845_c0_g1_i1:570-5453(-)